MCGLQQVDVSYEGQVFSFQLCRRQLVLGTAGPAEYFWMDGRQLRQGRGGPNFRPCVDLWWSSAEAAGETRLRENEVSLVLAECYPLVNTARAVQDVYVDAHLHRTADREYVIEEEEGVRQARSDRTYVLPAEEWKRLRNVAHTRDTNQVRSELESLFLGELPPRREMPAYRKAFETWTDNGIRALRTEGREGLRRYTGTVDEWIRKLRRRGNLDRGRMFLNMFSYECKVAFYMCYCSAWVGIVNRLSQNPEPNVLGDRFMRIWHHQNRAPDDSGISRDAFCGQILALHPLSAVILTSPEHLAAVGNWVGHPDYEALQANGRVLQCDAYWDLVATILISAHEYDRSRRQWEAGRKQATHADTESVSQQSRDDGTASAQILFEDFAAARGHDCPECSNTLTYVRHEQPKVDESTETDEPTVKVFFRCGSCDCETTIEVSHDDIVG